MEPMLVNSQRSIWWWRTLWFALAAWGIYLAIGATGWFSDTGLVRPLRSVVVLVCTAIFLLAWYATYCFSPARRTTRIDVARHSWNVSSMTSGAIVGLAYADWGLAWLVWNQAAWQSWCAPLGWVAVVLFMAATVLAMMGLSDPAGRRGYLIGLATLALVGLALALLFVQVKNVRPSTAMIPTDRFLHSSQGPATTGEFACQLGNRLPVCRSANI